MAVLYSFKEVMNTSKRKELLKTAVVTEDFVVIVVGFVTGSWAIPNAVQM